MSPAQAASDRPSGARLPKLGEVIEDRYRIDDLLGTGGMGAVFAGHDLVRDEAVAVKVMLPEELEHADSARRFVREARAARAIDSPHVAEVLHVGELPPGLPYMVMELLSGQSLDKIIRERAPLPTTTAVEYLLQACEGIAHAHALGIIHRDLKPSNLHVTLSPDGTELVKVLDFGVAKATVQLESGTDAISLTESSSLLGSPQYISPEQLRCAKNVDVRTDIWSLGLILNKMLTGRAAFEADSVGAQFAMIISDPPTPLRMLRPDLSGGLEAVVLRCLEKNVMQRYHDVGQLAQALLEFAPAGAHARVERINRTLAQAEALAPSGPVSSAESATHPPIDAFAHHWPDGETSATTRAWDASRSRSARRRGRNRRIAVAAVASVAAAAGVYYLFGLRMDKHPAPETLVRSSTLAGTSASAGQPSAANGAEPGVEATVRIDLVLDPPDARVELDGELTLDNPIRLPASVRTHEIVVSAPGYVAASKQLSATADTRLEIRLSPQEPTLRSSAPAAPPQPTRPGTRVGSTAAGGTRTRSAPAATASSTTEPAIKPKGPWIDTL